jgi:hypothetical protein
MLIECKIFLLITTIDMFIKQTFVLSSLSLKFYNINSPFVNSIPNGKSSDMKRMKI